MPDTELEIVQRAKDGDADAFETLVHTYEKRIYNLTLRMTGNPEDALDLSQEVFIRAYQALVFFKGQSSFSTWLYSIASNACIDFSRKQKKHKTVSLTPVDEEDAGAYADIADVRFDPEREYEKTELRESIAKALDELSYEHREVLVLREINGLSYHEIGEALDIEPGTVKSRISRARENLCRILGKTGNKRGKQTSNQEKVR